LAAPHLPDKPVAHQNQDGQTPKSQRDGHQVASSCVEANFSASLINPDLNPTHGQHTGQTRPGAPTENIWGPAAMREQPSMVVVSTTPPAVEESCLHEVVIFLLALIRCRIPILQHCRILKPWRTCMLGTMPPFEYTPSSSAAQASGSPDPQGSTPTSTDLTGLSLQEPDHPSPSGS
jgi:hypothetical protein